ncbi:hypothetical protein NC651_013867 [Populus alba x Populus x berolinensis]|nr:hypothetical protein NC651_013867 [Populus alba x Populus x berolinensis]
MPGFWIVRSEGVTLAFALAWGGEKKARVVCWCKCQSFLPLNCKILHLHLLLSLRNKMERQKWMTVKIQWLRLLASLRSYIPGYLPRLKKNL